MFPKGRRLNLRNHVVGIALSAVVLPAAVLVFSGCDSGENAIDAAKNQELDRQVRENMRLAQIAAEHFASERGGNQYPKSIDNDYLTYFPGGIEGRRASPVGPINPFTGANEFPVLGTEAELKTVSSNGKLDIEPGVVKYVPLAGGESYAIIGGSHDRKALMDQHNPDQVLILSNQ